MYIINEGITNFFTVFGIIIFGLIVITFIIMLFLFISIKLELIRHTKRIIRLIFLPKKKFTTNPFKKHDCKKCIHCELLEQWATSENYCNAKTRYVLFPPKKKNPDKFKKGWNKVRGKNGILAKFIQDDTYARFMWCRYQEK